MAEAAFGRRLFKDADALHRLWHSGETGEGYLSARNARRDTPHPNEFASTGGVALSRKGRGRSNAHRKMQSTSVR
ncbi:hypothetical protein GTH44_04200 [Bradyrhizobium japonicum]|nr:hypothetical protein [Bradyrhizobium japonicum]